MCAVVHGHLIGKRLEGQPADVASLKWYQTALNSNGSVAYTNLYTYGKNNERLLTMAVRFGDGNVLALNLYPERLNGLLAETRYLSIAIIIFAIRRVILCLPSMTAICR